MAGRGPSDLSDLPAVHELAARLDAPHRLAVTAARRAIAEERQRRLADAAVPVDLLDQAHAHLRALAAPSLRQVINASGVLLHTNLGRAPLAGVAREAVVRAAEGYSNLELDLESGRRGSRLSHVEGLLCELTGAEAALAVNNGAGAVLLAAAALAGPERSIVVSRGEQVEIGGGFRIPEVIAQSRSEMIEVGTTNRTHLGDYEYAVHEAAAPVGAILRVHQSNFRTQGFVGQVALDHLCRLGVPVIDDVGSGVLAQAADIDAVRDEPTLAASVEAGAALVCCSGDKLLGGPQAGLLVGRGEAIEAARRHPLMRALRLDKLSLAALEATLMLYRDPARALEEIPVLRMLRLDEPALTERVQRVRAGVGEDVEILAASARVGGGALPLTELPGPVLALPGDAEALAERLRSGEPPVVGRIHEGRLLLDPRTVQDAELDRLVQAVRTALGR
jgi:L-seryl-tRNA(Ser) seleniumtransferase